MSYRISAADPQIEFDPLELEKQVAAVAKNNGITNQAGWVTFVNGISTLPQAVAVCQGLLRGFKLNP